MQNFFWIIYNYASIIQCIILRRKIRGFSKKKNWHRFNFATLKKTQKSVIKHLYVLMKNAFIWIISILQTNKIVGRCHSSFKKQKNIKCNIINRLIDWLKSKIRLWIVILRFVKLIIIIYFIEFYLQINWWLQFKMFLGNERHHMLTNKLFIIDVNFFLSLQFFFLNYSQVHWNVHSIIAMQTTTIYKWYNGRHMKGKKNKYCW